MPLLPIQGGLTVSGSFNVTGSFSVQQGSLTYLPYLSGSYNTGSFCTSSYYSGSLLITGSCDSGSIFPEPGVPFLYVINQVLWFYNGSSWAQLSP